MTPEIKFGAFNGAYYDKDGNVKNIDGKTNAASGNGNGRPDMLPFSGAFYDSDGNISDIGDLLQQLANSNNGDSNNSNGNGEVVDEKGNRVLLPNAEILAKIGLSDGMLTFDGEPLVGIIGTF